MKVIGRQAPFVFYGATYVLHRCFGNVCLLKSGRTYRVWHRQYWFSSQQPSDTGLYYPWSVGKDYLWQANYRQFGFVKSDIPDLQRAYVAAGHY